MKSFGIKAKLIFLFIVVKVIPLLIILYIAIMGVKNIEESFTCNLENSSIENRRLLQTTATQTINDSIQALDKISQTSYEKFTLNIASQIADFLYERDNDILFLAKEEPSNKLFNNFFNSKQRDIIQSPKYIYDDNSSSWIKEKPTTTIKRTIIPIEDNKKNFNFIDPIEIKKVKIPIYKEITFFDLNGIEKYKKSIINPKLLNISDKNNTYIHSEDYFSKIKSLKDGEIYVSHVIGEYVGTKIIGTFTKEKAQKVGIAFEPQKYGYAGKENPLGKRFQGIIRFITPIYKNNSKIGYLSLALDHRHIMEFTDKLNTTSKHLIQNISDASSGNYAFMWDDYGRSISHPRDYFISGFNPSTGKRVAPWVSADIAQKFKESNITDLNKFLEDYPIYQNQSSSKKPNLSQLLNDGEVILDCRYLNFAPQCNGWENIVKSGGYGSFVIFWSKVWKLTSVATIPYYTGEYNRTKKGFGFVSIGANVAKFHQSANQTKDKIDIILNKQEELLEKHIKISTNQIELFINNTIKKLTFDTIILIIIVIFIAVYIANYLTDKINKLLEATNELSNGNFNIKLDMNSNDELGVLAKSFQNTVDKMKLLVEEKNRVNLNLKKQVDEAIEKTKAKDQQLLSQSRLAQMGEMISMIAHQWRQPLAAISATSNSLNIKVQLQTLDDKTILELTDRISQYSQHLSSTIDDFRLFFKPNKEKTNTNYNEILTSVLNIIETSIINKNITIKKELNSTTQFYSYPNEIKQVILNLLKNAEDVLIEREIENPEIIIKSYNNILEIIDNGGGVKDEIYEKIFDPYFTTKDEKNGTGLGLYMSKTIIEEHCKGTLTIRNSENRAIFRISLNNNI